MISHNVLKITENKNNYQSIELNMYLDRDRVERERERIQFIIN